MSNRNVCVKCGASLMSSWSFCPICGHPIADDATKDQQLLDAYFKQEFPEEKPAALGDEDTFSTEKMRQELDLTDYQIDPILEESDPVYVSEREEEPEYQTEELPTIAKFEAVPEEQPKPKKRRYEPEDDYDDDESAADMLKSKWPLLLLIFLLLAAIILAFVIFIKPTLSPGKKKDEPIQETAEPEPTPEVTPEATPEPTPEPVKEKTLTIGNQQINVRDQASTAGRILRTAKPGETYTYTEVTEAGGYTWYKIGENEWIANNGHWLTLND